MWLNTAKFGEINTTMAFSNMVELVLKGRQKFGPIGHFRAGRQADSRRV